MVEFEYLGDGSYRVSRTFPGLSSAAAGARALEQINPDSYEPTVVRNPNVKIVENGDYDHRHDQKESGFDEFARTLADLIDERRVRSASEDEGEESKAEQEPSLPGLSGLVGSEVLQFPSQWPEGEVDTLASEVFGTGRD